MEKINFNTFIFSRTRPINKLHTINAITDDELLNLLNIRESTLIRIIKEAGNGVAGSHDRVMTLMEHVGNGWNSSVDDIYLYKKKAYVTFYIQYSNTDSCVSKSLSEFLNDKDFKVSYTYEDRYGNRQINYYHYNLMDKARVIKEILLTYIHRKYNI